MWKLTRKQKHAVAFGIGLLFIAYGAMGAIFKLQLNKAVADQISFVLMMIAAMLLLGKDKTEPAKSEEQPVQESAVEAPEIEDHKSEQ
ncbi:hypothetical protein EDC14_100752 [Hydrogenispora ethanolica]|uniref:Uncharacterized protein n=1 Tax=Hydrogenispora ethanolica TaxID=1082276 RepID=A0A4R1RZB7_HYDET|nr:hypothetical protein [Hydrogenispora ethanolica]TCL71590.1 hypothetical protein EDC14_100752 [Hydrogenispora ethanolica]